MGGDLLSKMEKNFRFVKNRQDFEVFLPLLVLLCCFSAPIFAYLQENEPAPSFILNFNSMRRGVSWKPGTVQELTGSTHSIILNKISMVDGQGICLNIRGRTTRTKYSEFRNRKFWIVVHIDGRLYGAPFGEGVVSGPTDGSALGLGIKECLFSDGGSLWHTLSKIAQATKYAPFQKWTLGAAGGFGASTPGDDPEASDLIGGQDTAEPTDYRNVIGLAVSKVTPEKGIRSAIVWYRLPIGGTGGDRVGVNGRPIFTERPRIRNVPTNMGHIISEMEKKYTEADLCHIQTVHHGYESCNKDGWEMTDRAVQKLHAMDPNIGHYGHCGNPHGWDPVLPHAGLVAYWLGENTAQNERSGKHNLVSVTSLYDLKKNGWDGDKFWFNGHRWGFCLGWVYPRPESPDYGYDPGHPGPLPLVHQELIEELKKLDGEQAEKFEQVHRTMFTNLQGAHLGCTGAQAASVAQGEREKARLLSESNQGELGFLLAVHQERMKSFEKPRELIDSLEKRFNETQTKLMQDLGSNHQQLLQNLERVHRPCVGPAAVSVHAAEVRKGQIVRDTGTEGANLLEQYHVRRMEIVKKF